MILIENEKYFEYTPSLEDELEQMVSEHSKEIFGSKSLYFNTKKQIKTGAGIISIPDGYVLLVGSKPQWHVVEVELSGHNVYEHVVPQISKFIHGMKNPEVKHKLAEELYNRLIKDQAMLDDFRGMNDGELFKYISDCVKTQPSITVIAEQITPELIEALETLADNVVEFKTFKSLKGNHAHYFEPIENDAGMIKPLIVVLPSPRSQLYHEFFEEIANQFSIRSGQSKLKAPYASWLGFGAGLSGLNFNWEFRSNNRFSIHLYIDTGDKEKNKRIFDQLKKQQKNINTESLFWERLDDKKGSRIAIYTTGSIDEVTEDKEARKKLIDWAINNMDSFSKEFKPIVKAL